MKILLLIVILGVTAAVQPQKEEKPERYYDKFTDTITYQSKETTVSKSKFLSSQLQVWARSFVIVRSGHLDGAGLVFKTFDDIGFYQVDTLYVIADGRRLELGVDRAIGGHVLAYVPMAPEALRTLLSSSDLQMRIGSTEFKLKEQSLKTLRSVVPYLDSAAASPIQNTPPSVIKSYGITLEGYDHLKTGMHYAEAVKILGENGVEMARTEVSGYITISYQWKAKQGVGNMILMFQNDKLISKAQALLK